MTQIKTIRLKQQKVNIEEITQIHMAALPDDFLPSLGKMFLSEIFYPSALKSPYAKILSAKDQHNNTIGFVLVTTDSDKFFSTVIKENIWRCIVFGLNYLSKSFKNIQHLLQIFLSGLKSDAIEGFGEIYIIAVSEKQRGKGVGKLLVEASNDYLKNAGNIGNSIKTLTTNKNWIKFFLKAGWKMLKQFDFIGKEYVLLTSEFKS